MAAVLAAVLGLTACAAAADPASASAAADDDRPLVLTTFTVLADMASVVAGDDLRVESITKAGTDVHGYEPTPGDIARASGADLILDNGLGLEDWFAKFVDSVDAPHVVVSEGIEPIDIAAGVDAGADRPNPHAWMSPALAQTYVDNMARAFAELDPANADGYDRRARDYNAQLAEVGEELDVALASVPEDQRVLVTCEGAFSYLARDAGLTEVYLWPVNADQQVGPQRVAAAITQVRDRNVPAVFCESTVSDRAMQQVVEGTDAEFAGVLYVDSLSAPDGPVPTYLDLIRHDAELIAEALGGEENS